MLTDCKSQGDGLVEKCDDMALRQSNSSSARAEAGRDELASRKTKAALRWVGRPFEGLVFSIRMLIICNI